MHSADASPPDAPARQLRDSLARGLRTEPTVRLAWLFGSRARGTERRESDVDVAVLVDHGIAYRAIRDDLGDLDAFRRWALGKLDAG